MTYQKLPLLTATAGLILISACTSIDTPTDSSNTRTGEGIALGALGGAAAGALVGNNSAQSVAIGALIGGVAGGLIGNDLDKQAAELQAAFTDNRIMIIKDGKKLIVRMPQDILFDIDSTKVRSGLRSDLGVLADSLNRYPGTTVVVQGHTDNTGAAAYNQTLSQGRADAVAGILVNRGVASGRVRARGKGEDSPITTNQTPEGRAQNRRVEIIIRQNS